VGLSTLHDFCIEGIKNPIFIPIRKDSSLKTLAPILSGLLLILSAPFAIHAAVLTFDDIAPTHVSSIPNGYGGFDWEEMWYLDGQDIALMSGYINGTVSGDYVAFNYDAQVATVSGSLFNFEGAYLTGVWNDQLNITVKGFLSGAEVYSRTVVADYNSPTWFDLNFNGIDELTFYSFGGVPVPDLEGGGAHFAMDDFTYNTSRIPLPTTLLLLGSGLAGVAALRKRFVQT
jgi:hypothetical protein